MHDFKEPMYFCHNKKVTCDSFQEIYVKMEALRQTNQHGELCNALPLHGEAVVGLFILKL
jgi:hypothetical protein